MLIKLERMKKEFKQSTQHSQAKSTHSFILRLWRQDPPEGIDWRASLEDAHTGERFGFSSVEQLHKFLLELIDTHRVSGAKG